MIANTYYGDTMHYAGYWGVLICVFLLICFYIAVKNYTKIIILQHMLFIEKKGRLLGLAAGRQKLEWVYEQYNSSPGIVRFVITQEIYGTLIQELFDRAMQRGRHPFDS